MPDKTKTRKEVIDGKKFEFACGNGGGCCLGVAENPDGSMDLMDSETGQRMNGLSRYTVTRFIAMMNEKTK